VISFSLCMKGQTTHVSENRFSFAGDRSLLSFRKYMTDISVS
jgi:hypothetical protein